MEQTEFDKFVELQFIAFMQKNGLTSGMIKDGTGNKATVAVDKHGYYKVTYSREKEVRNV